MSPLIAKALSKRYSCRLLEVPYRLFDGGSTIELVARPAERAQNAVYRDPTPRVFGGIDEREGRFQALLHPSLERGITVRKGGLRFRLAQFLVRRATSEVEVHYGIAEAEGLE
jgi:hypothetical protein